MTEEEKREWHVEACIEKLRPGDLSDRFKVQGRPHFEEEDITDEILKECYVTMARIVNQHGERYLPIFERIHAEIENRNAKRKLLEAALKISKNSTEFSP